MYYLFLAQGFEETEAMAPLDIMRRADIEVYTVGVGAKVITGAHNIPVVADVIDCEVAPDKDCEGIILPGGMPGTLNLEKAASVQKFIDYCAKNNKLIGAICAAPSILGHRGLLDGKNAVCFPGFEEQLGDAKVLKNVKGEEVYPVLYNGTTYLPVRAVAEALGASVFWNGDIGLAMLSK